MAVHFLQVSSQYPLSHTWYMLHTSYLPWFDHNLHSLMMGQWGPKHVGVDVLKHYCNSNEMCAFVGLHPNTLMLLDEYKLRSSSLCYFANLLLLRDLSPILQQPQSISILQSDKVLHPYGAKWEVKKCCTEM